MNDQLIKLMQKPLLWERSTEKFWDDEHISKMMLLAHLDFQTDAASRNIKVINQSVDWLTKIIPSGSKLLDLGCGPGLYTKLLAENGYDVTGIDISGRSITYAKEHDKLTKYINMNYLELDSINEYDAIIMIYCDYAAMIKEERAVLLKQIYQALKPGGVFIFDVFTPVHYAQLANRKTWSVSENGGFWSDMPHVALDATYLYDDSISVDQTIIITEKEVKQYLIWDTVYTKDSLLAEVAPFGFVMTGIFDDVCGKEYTGIAETMCLVISKRK